MFVHNRLEFWVSTWLLHITLSSNKSGASALIPVDFGYALQMRFPHACYLFSTSNKCSHCRIILYQILCLINTTSLICRMIRYQVGDLYTSQCHAQYFQCSDHMFQLNLSPPPRAFGWQIFIRPATFKMFKWAILPYPIYCYRCDMVNGTLTIWTRDPYSIVKCGPPSPYSAMEYGFPLWKVDPPTDIYNVCM